MQKNWNLDPINNNISMQGEPLPTITQRHLITRNGNKTSRSHGVLQLLKDNEVHVLSQLPPRIIRLVLRGQVLGFQTLEQILQCLVLGHWTTTAKDMEQHCQLNEFVAAFAYDCIPHHLQHRVRLPAHKQLLILHMLEILVPVA
jgi:hypothetical protein